MAFAPHVNNDYADGNDVALILGAFDGADYGIHFEYAERPGDPEQWDFAPGFPHVIYVGDGDQHRYGKVLKTVAYVAVDEAEFNVAVVEKWKIKNQKDYPVAWARKLRAESYKILHPGALLVD